MERQIEDLWRKPSKARSSCRAKFNIQAIAASRRRLIAPLHRS